MIRLLFTAFVLSFVGALAAQAGTSYRDPTGRFMVTVPDGWEYARPETTSMLGIAMAKKEGDAGGVCLILVLIAPDTKDMSQAELEDAAQQIFTREYWTSTFTQAGASDVAIEEMGVRDYSGRKAHFAVASANFSRDGVTLRMATKQAFYLIPGSLHTVMCMTRQEHYAGFAPDFEVVFASYVPGGGLVAMAPGAPTAPGSTLTLFAGPRYDGERRVLGQGAPDLAQIGWNATASLAAAGPSAWQICAGLNFSGRCDVIRSGGTQDFGGRAVRIASARPLSAARPLGVMRVDPRRILGLAHQATGMNMNEAMRMLATRRR